MHSWDVSIVLHVLWFYHYVDIVCTCLHNNYFCILCTYKHLPTIIHESTEILWISTWEFASTSNKITIIFISVPLTVRKLTSSSLSNIHYLPSSLCVSNAHIYCNIIALDPWFCHCLLSDCHQRVQYHYHLWTIVLISGIFESTPHSPKLCLIGNWSNDKEKENCRILKLGGKVLWIFKYLDQIPLLSLVLLLAIFFLKIFLLTS